MKAQYIEIDEHGNTHYYSDREMRIPHREDGPAFVSPYGDKAWFVNGQRHREDGPAIEYINGDKSWYLNGERISEDEHARRTSKKNVWTMDEIAAKFGITVEQLKIKK